MRVRRPRPRRPGAALAVLLLVLLAGCAGAGADDDMPGAPDDDLTAPRSGGTLPDVRLDALAGDGALDLADLEGPAVVNLWASWCGPCERELPYYQEFSERYAGVVDVVGIDFQETRVDRARAMLRDAGVTYPVYADPDGELRAVALPKVVLVDADGEIAFEQYLEIDGPDQLAALVRDHLGVEQ